MNFIITVFNRQLISLSLISAIVVVLDLISLLIFTQFLALLDDSGEGYTMFWGLIEDPSPWVVGLFVPIVLGVYLINALLMKRIQRLSTNLGYDLASDLHRRVLLDSEFVLKLSRADFISHLYTEANRFSTNVLSPLVIISNKFLMGMAVLCVMLYSAFLPTLISVIILLIVSIVYSFITKKTLVRNSKVITKLNSQRISHLQESYDGIEYLMTYNLRNEHARDFKNQNNEFAKKHSLHQYLQQLPKYILECVIIVGILLLITLMHSGNVEFNQGQIYILGIGAMKLLPNVNIILASFTKFLANLDSIDVMKSYYENFTDEQSSIKKDLTEYQEVKGITIENIAFKYPNGNSVFNGLSLDLKNKNWYLLDAPSGTGKTTLLRLILCIYSPVQGRIRFGDIDAIFDRQILVTRCFGYVGQEVSIFRGTVLDNITLKRSVPKQELEDLLISCKINFLDKNPYKLSGGQKQRLGIARALIGSPNVLILDEAFTGIDRQSAGAIRGFIEKTLAESLIIEVNHNEANVNYTDLIKLC